MSNNSRRNTRPVITEREFYIANDDLNSLQKFPNNFIKTSKYTLIDFFPKTLLFQFKRYANIYFLFIAILQSIKTISPLNPVTAIAPLVFVLALSMLREGIEDYHRHKSDKEANASICRVYKGGKFVEEQWKNVKMGDILLVKEEEFFACDLIVISTSLEGGVCYIKTASLDGENNLKPKGAPKETLDLYNHSTGIVRVEGKVGCMLPNSNLYAFEGTLSLFGYEQIILGAKQLLLRGAKLMNTEWIVGTAVYTGSDTKIMRNAEVSKPKISRIEVLTNHLILAILIFQTTFCLFAAVGNLFYNESWSGQEPFTYVKYSIGAEFIINFLSYFLLLNTMIPISLIVTLELVKLVQAYFIEKDESIRNEKKNRSTRVMTSSINEELGMVEYIFSDKTGTLTCNEMQFKLAVIGNDTYGDKSILRPAREVTRLASMKEKDSEKLHETVATGVFKDHRLTDLLVHGIDNYNETVNMTNSEKMAVLYRITNRVELVKEYFTILATCHECMVEVHDGISSYHGPSPDEITLVDAAASSGFRFEGGSEHTRKVNILGTETLIDILYIFEFNSDRKRMSVIARGPDGVIKLYVKGADSIIQARLAPFGDQPYLEHNQKQLKKFSKKGLRTLMVAMRVIDQAEFVRIRQRFDQISHLPSKEAEIMKLAEEVEKNLFLLGSTAVEDRLQDNVPQTIFDCIQAKIKVWMLTGDKLETAINIAKSCNLIQPGFQVLECSDKTLSEVKETLVMHRKRYDYFTQNKIPKAFVVEGESLAMILDDKLLRALLLSIVKGCEAVVCCRVTPKQKAEVVRLIKKSMNKVTLAIGDGANDVNMIQEAHIGVGIYGNEGMRAVQASDFAIPEFQCLWRLLFVHGRWSYIRISDMILYFFYKNMVFTIPQFYFGFICSFTARAVFDDFYITFYNMIFTALPLALRAITDQEVNYKYLERRDGHYDIQKRKNIRKYLPHLYYVGQRNKIFTIGHFTYYIMLGLIHAALIFIVCLFGIADRMIDNGGDVADFWIFSITYYTCVIFVVDLKLALQIKYWTWLMLLTIVFLSIGLYIGYMWISDNFFSLLLYKTCAKLYSSVQFYLCVLLTMGVVAFFDYSLNYYRATYKTTITDYFKLLIKKKKDHEDQQYKFLDPKVHEEKKPEINVLHGLGGEAGPFDFNYSLVVNDDERNIGQLRSSVNHSATKKNPERPVRI